MLLYLCCSSNCSSFGHWESFQLAPMSLFDIPPPFICLFIFGALPLFLTLQYKPGSKCIFPSPVLESTISLRSPGSCYWGNSIQDQDLGARYAHCNWVLFLLVLSAERVRKYIYVFRHTCIYFCMYLPVSISIFFPKILSLL